MSDEKTVHNDLTWRDRRPFDPDAAYSHSAILARMRGEAPLLCRDPSCSVEGIHALSDRCDQMKSESQSET